MEERHERIVSASLAAAAALLTTFQQQQQQDIPLDQPDGQTQGQSEGQTLPPAAAAVEETRQKLREILSGPGFFKKYLVSKSILVRRASYGFVQVLSAAAADLLRECQAAAAPAVLGALQVRQELMSWCVCMPCIMLEGFIICCYIAELRRAERVRDQ